MDLKNTYSLSLSISHGHGDSQHRHFIIPRSCTLVHHSQGRFILLGVPFPFLSHLGKQPSDTPFSFLGANEAGLEPTLAASGHLLWLGLDPCGWGQLAHPAGHAPGSREDRGHGPASPGPSASSWQGGPAAVLSACFTCGLPVLPALT